MIYRSTRGTGECSASEAILLGLAPDGGLFLPDSIPALKLPLDALKDLSYQETAYLVMRDFLSDFTEEELRSCIAKAYDDKFDTEEIAPLVKAGDQYFLELFHGATIAFKDMALSILPHLLTTAMRKNRVEEEVVILTATSGDTGKAALEGFLDVDRTRIIVFYPKGGVSRIQELQMVTTKGKNTKVISVQGNFDDCQTGVKEILNDKDFAAKMKAAGFRFSSANSINIGRLVPQVAYYVYAYGRMLKMGAIKEGERLNFTVPTGNFGNILAAYLAKEMGLPIGKLICASNDNKVLFDFFCTGTYDRNRAFVLTTSPSMDILISSNFERLVYLSCHRDEKKNAALMKALSETGRYTVTDEMKENMRDFYGAYATEAQVLETIRRTFEESGYVLDPHTAVAAYADRKYKDETKDMRKSVVISTASPYKFGTSVLQAIAPEFKTEDDFRLAEELHQLSKREIPKAVSALQDAKILHRENCTVADMQAMVSQYLHLE